MRQIRTLAKKESLKVRICRETATSGSSLLDTAVRFSDPRSIETSGPGLQSKAELKGDGTIGVTL